MQRHAIVDWRVGSDHGVLCVIVRPASVIMTTTPSSSSTLTTAVCEQLTPPLLDTTDKALQIFGGVKVA